MALTLKVTKFINKGPSPISPLDYLFQVEYHNFTIPNPPTQSVSFSIARTDADEGSALQDAVDTALGSLGTDEVDWTK